MNPGVGITRGIGMFDDDNGLFFRDNAGTLQVVCRTSASGSAVDVSVDQADWNIDTMAGGS